MSDGETFQTSSWQRHKILLGFTEDPKKPVFKYQGGLTLSKSRIIIYKGQRAPAPMELQFVTGVTIDAFSKRDPKAVREALQRAKSQNVFQFDPQSTAGLYDLQRHIAAIQMPEGPWITFKPDFDPIRWEALSVNQPFYANLRASLGNRLNTSARLIPPLLSNPHVKVLLVLGIIIVFSLIMMLILKP